MNLLENFHWYEIISLVYNEQYKNSSDMEDKIFDIVTDLIRDDISKNEAIDKLLILYSVSKRHLIEEILHDVNSCDGEYASEKVQSYLDDGC
jgi:hypothetical protein